MRQQTLNTEPSPPVTADGAAPAEEATNGVRRLRSKRTLEQKLQEQQEQIAARLAGIAAKRKADTRERMARLDQIIGAVCRADQSLHETIKEALGKGARAPKDREFLRVEGWL